MIRYIVILVLICNVSCENLMLPQGSSCSWDGIPGWCVSIYQCLTAALDIANRTYPPICSFQGNIPIICCTDCKLVEDTRLLVRNPVLGLLFKTGTEKAKDKCVDYIHTLEYECKTGLLPVPPVKKKLDTFMNCTYEGSDFNQATGFAAGGRNAFREEFPHMALLGLGDTVDTAQWSCGGSVISERFILTAAHCVFSRTLGPVKFIALGILKRSDPPSLWKIYNVQRAITHPGYKPPSKYHDIALLQTDREIAFSPQILPACLHVDDNVDKYASAAGWGALGYKENVADVLQSVLLRQYTDEECSERYPEHRNLARGFDTSIQMCYGDTENQAAPTDTCEGDSGGPLHSRDHERCVYTVLGVTSYGRPCGEAAGAGIYTRVRSYVPWIEDIVWPNL